MYMSCSCRQRLGPLPLCLPLSTGVHTGGRATCTRGLAAGFQEFLLRAVLGVFAPYCSEVTCNV